MMTNIFVFLLGLIFGSFLNALIWRLHTGESLGGRSYCPHCKKKIVWYDNIPLLSFILLRGRCRQCGGKISWQYPVVELVTGVLFLLSWMVGGDGNEACIMKHISWGAAIPMIDNTCFMLQILRDWFLICVLIVIFVYDLRWYLILDKVSLPAIVVMVIMNLALGMSWQNMLISVIIGAGVFIFQFVISKGRWIGGGDIRLGALMGVSLGWPQVLVALFLAYVLGSLVGIFLILFKKKEWGSEVPFGTFLSVATVIVLFWGREILNWYLNLL